MGPASWGSTRPPDWTTAKGSTDGRSNDELRGLVAGAEADLVFVGHTHEPMIRRLGEVDVVNLGSVSNPQTADVRASYVLLDATDSSTEFVHRRVHYDRDEFVRRVHQSRHPSAEFILSFPRPERLRQPAHADHVPLGGKLTRRQEWGVRRGGCPSPRSARRPNAGSLRSRRPTPGARCRTARRRRLEVR